MSTQRQPKGTTVGGQFAESTHAEAPLSLDDAYGGTLSFISGTDGSPESAEDWLDDIHHRQGAGWRAVKNLGPAERAIVTDDLRRIATQSGDSDEDVSDAIRRENRVGIRPISITPDRDYDGAYTLSYPASPNSTASIRTNPHEMEAWADALLAHAARIRQSDTSAPVPSVILESRDAAQEAHAASQAGSDVSDDEARAILTRIDTQVGLVTADADARRAEVDVPVGFPSAQSAQMREDAVHEHRRALTMLARERGRLLWRFRSLAEDQG